MYSAFLLFSLLALAAEAATFPSEKFNLYEEGYIQARSCSFALFTSASFCSKQSYQTYSCFCKSKPAMASMAGCLKTLKSNTDSAVDWIVNYCVDLNITVSRENFTRSLSYLESDGKNFTVVPKNATSPTMINYPIYVNKTSAHVYYRAYEDYLGNFNWSYWFTNTLYGYWAFVFVVAAACNWSVVMFPSLRTAMNGKVAKWWRKYVTLPALVHKKKTNHQELFGLFDFLVPTRFETIVLSLFFWLTFLFNALYIGWSEGNPVFKTRHSAIIKYVADRTGIMGTMLLPLLILTGGRNNFLQWVTRWDFSRFVLFHRWIGRVVVALVFVHSVAYSYIYLKRGNYMRVMKKEYIIYGTVGIVSGGLICFQGLLFLRRRFYEIFLAVHILLAIAFILGTWRHIELFKYMEWVLASVAVWGFDRVVRVLRMFWFGAPKSTVTLLANSCLRIEVPKPSHWKSVPGGHAWVYFCHSWYFWQSHPFTFFDSVEEKDKLVFILKAKQGATQLLANQLAKKLQKSCTIRVCVEGPYGESCSVKSHDQVVFVAGGNGIPGIFSECFALAQKVSSQNLKLVWIVREFTSLQWVWNELHELRNTKVQTTIYVTRPDESDLSQLLENVDLKDDTSSEEKKSVSETDGSMFESLSKIFPHINIQYERPTMEEIVDREVEEASKAVAFVTCGHPVMVDDLRYAVVQKIDNSEKRLDFFEQLQVWA